MEFAELKKHLKAQKPKSCYYCYGDDEYVVSRAVALVKGLAAEPEAFNVADREFSSAKELVDELMQLPLTGEYRVVISRGKPDFDGLAGYLGSPNPSAVLVVPEYTPHDSWNSRTAAPDVPSGVTGVDCNRLPLALVTPFVRSVTAKSGATIDDRAAELLYSRCGGYMTRVNQEIQKLALMRSGAAITCDDVTREVRADAEFVVFELTDSIVKHDTVRALSIVDAMAKSNELSAAFTLLYNRFKRMFAAAVDPDGLSELGIKPYMANRLKSEAAAFSKPRLKALVDSLADADLGYKTGAMSQYDALYTFVALASRA